MFYHWYPFVKMDSGLNAYRHVNADIPNIWVDAGQPAPSLIQRGYHPFVIIFVCSFKSIHIPSLVFVSVRYMPIYILSVMYGLRLFILFTRTPLCTLHLTCLFPSHYGF